MDDTTTQYAGSTTRRSTRSRSITTTPSSTTIGRSTWDSYKAWYIQFVKRNYQHIDFVEETIARCVFWFPHPTTDTNTTTSTTTTTEAGREVCYGLLALHRIVVHLAVQAAPRGAEENDYDHEYTGYGTTLHTQQPTALLGLRGSSSSSPPPSPISIRLGLTLLQALLPAVLALTELRVQSRPSTHTTAISTRDTKSTTTTTASSRVRFLVEKIKFLLRMYLLVSYWKQQLSIQQQQQQQQQQPEPSYDEKDTDKENTAGSAMGCGDIGLLREGGMYRIEGTSQGLTWEQHTALQRRHTYFGQRTGWTVNVQDDDRKTNVDKENQGLWGQKRIGRCRWRSLKHTLFGNSSSSNKLTHNSRTILGELLYTVRPLLWALFESRNNELISTRPPQEPRRKEVVEEQQWTITSPQSSGSSSSTSTSTSTSTSKRGSVFSVLFAKNRKIKTWLSELLFLLEEGRGGETETDGRGLNKYKTKSTYLLRGWILCFAMDLVSLRLLDPQQRHTSSSCHNKNDGRQYTRYRNRHTDDELQRRKVRLWLYLLRGPVWSTISAPVLGWFARYVLQHIPFGVGRILEVYLWDWVLYYQHPFIAEEG